MEPPQWVLDFEGQASSKQGGTTAGQDEPFACSQDASLSAHSQHQSFNLLRLASLWWLALAGDRASAFRFGTARKHIRCLCRGHRRQRSLMCPGRDG